MSEGQPSVPVKNRLNRRGFLRGVGFAAGSLVTGAVVGHLAGCGPDQGSGAPQPNLPIEKEFPKNIEKETEEEQIIFEQDGVTVWGKGERLIPSKWQDSTGRSGVFDRQQLESVANQLGQAELKIASTTRVDTKNSQPGKIPEINKSLEVFDDILSPEELKFRGVEIFDSEGVGLQIRAGAFLPGELLEDFQEGGPNRIQVIIIDNPALNRQSQLDPRYSQVRNAVDVGFKEDFAKTAESSRAYIQDRLRKQGEDATDQASKINIEARLKAIETLTDDEVHQWGLYYGSTTGYYLEPKPEEGMDKAALFLAIGERPKFANFISVVVSGDKTKPNYELRMTNVDLQEVFLLQYPRTLVPDQSYPTTDNFPVLEEPVGVFGEKSAPAVDPERKTPGFVLRHELSHAWRIKHVTGESKDVWSEWETDLTARGTIEKAQAKKERGDNSGYYFILQNKKDHFSVVT